jgi:hypothetical protein
MWQLFGKLCEDGASNAGPIECYSISGLGNICGNMSLYFYIVLFEKLVVAQLIDNYPPSTESKTPLPVNLDPILVQLNSHS